MSTVRRSNSPTICKFDVATLRGVNIVMCRKSDSQQSDVAIVRQAVCPSFYSVHWSDIAIIVRQTLIYGLHLSFIYSCLCVCVCERVCYCLHVVLYNCGHLQLSSFQSLDRLGRRGDVRDDSAEIFFQPFRKEAIVSSSGMGRDIHSLMLSIQHFLCRPRRRPPSSKVP